MFTGRDSARDLFSSFFLSVKGRASLVADRHRQTLQPGVLYVYLLALLECVGSASVDDVCNSTIITPLSDHSSTKYYESE